MKCPKCGKEINTVEMVESVQYAEVNEYKENEDGTFSWDSLVDKDVVDSQVEGVRCPECEESLKWHLDDKGRMVIVNGVSS